MQGHCRHVGSQVQAQPMPVCSLLRQRWLFNTELGCCLCFHTFTPMAKNALGVPCFPGAWLGLWLPLTPLRNSFVLAPKMVPKDKPEQLLSLPLLMPRRWKGELKVTRVSQEHRGKKGTRRVLDGGHHRANKHLLTSHFPKNVPKGLA